jgi:hypothetical protein
MPFETSFSVLSLSAKVLSGFGGGVPLANFSRLTIHA